MLTKEERAVSRAICDAATPGEWVTPPTFSGICSRSGDILVINRIVNTRDADMLFITHARTALPAALDALEAETKRADEAEICSSKWMMLYDKYNSLYLDSKIDRDRWKARAIRAQADYEKASNHATNLTRRVAALEKALCNTADKCCSCEFQDCGFYLSYGSVECDKWQFDEARFVLDATGKDGEK